MDATTKITINHIKVRQV